MSKTEKAAAKKSATEETTEEVIEETAEEVTEETPEEIFEEPDPMFSPSMEAKIARAKEESKKKKEG